MWISVTRHVCSCGCCRLVVQLFFYKSRHYSQNLYISFFHFVQCQCLCSLQNECGTSAMSGWEKMVDCTCQCHDDGDDGEHHHHHHHCHYHHYLCFYKKSCSYNFWWQSSLCLNPWFSYPSTKKQWVLLVWPFISTSNGTKPLTHTHKTNTKTTLFATCKQKTSMIITTEQTELIWPVVKGRSPIGRLYTLHTTATKQRVPHQNGISQAYYIVEIHHSGLELSKIF